MATDEQDEQEPAQPAQPAQPVMALWLVLAFTVDDQIALRVPIAINLPIPPAGQVGTLHLALDGRGLLRALEPALGPTPASRGGLIVPNRVLPLHRRKQDD